MDYFKLSGVILLLEVVAVFLEESILKRVKDNFSIRSRSLRRALGISHTTVLKTLCEHGIHPYHLQRVQIMNPDHYLPFLNFARWYLQYATANQTFSVDVLSIVEATVTRSIMFNIHYSYLKAHGNPHGIKKTPT